MAPEPGVMPAAAMAAPFDPELIPQDPELELAPEVEAWHIRSIPEAEWAMRLLAALTKEAEAIGEQAGLFRDQIDWWERDQLAPIARKLAFFQDHLEGYALELRETTGKKHLALPSGQVTTRVTKARVTTEDPEAFLEWAITHLALSDLDKVAPRQVSLSGTQSLVGLELEEVPCSVDVAMGCCGFIWTWLAELEDTQPPKEGDLVECPECQEPAPVVQVTMLEVCHVPVYQGDPVPGLTVVEEQVSSKAKPGAA